MKNKRRQKAKPRPKKEDVPKKLAEPSRQQLEERNRDLLASLTDKVRH